LAVTVFLCEINIIEYNDNRLSLYCGQGGKCVISKMSLEIVHMHCHHITPINLGGDDRYSNLLFVTDKVHILIHAIAEETIKALLCKLRLDDKQISQLNKLRQLAGLNVII
jgi:CRISPR/Cas system Type II protein with McrA/HNH and RuvC-like nuclease domain